MVIRTGSRRWRRASASSRRGIVAEKSTVCRSSGVSSRIASMSSAKPMSSISSASSRTTVATSSSCRLPRLSRSSARPGVATTTSTPDSRDAQLPHDRGAAVDRAARGRRGPCRSGAGPRTPGWRARGWARAPGATGARSRAVRRPAAGASAARTRRSCRCPWPPGRAGPGPRPAAGSPPAGSAWAPRSRGSRARASSSGRSPRSSKVGPCSLALVRRPSRSIVPRTRSPRAGGPVTGSAR